MAHPLRFLAFIVMTVGLLALSGPGAAVFESAPAESEWVPVTDERPAWMQQDEGPSISDVVAAAHEPGTRLQAVTVASNGR